MDSDFASDIETRRSITGFVFNMAGGPFCWKNQAKAQVDTSSAMAEYISIYESARETISFRQFLSEVGLRQNSPPVFYSDNNAAISIASNSRTEERSKHIDIKFHYTRELVEREELKLEHCLTNLMVADYLTKQVSTQKFLWCRAQIGLQLYPSSVWEGVL